MKIIFIASKICKFFNVILFQASVLRAWLGKPENVKAGQDELLKRARVRVLFI